ncbi:F161A protein, partial [Vidua chalybeata]|nr:F161A protein [Vidua chalybeata]
RPTWDKSSYQPLHLHKSFSDSDLSDPLGSSVSDTSDEELVFEENGSKAGSSSFAKQQIEKMWDGFCLEDYISCAKHSLPSSSACRKGHKKEKVWSPRVTMPKPFQMTIREAQKKEENIKSKSQIELENHLLKKQLEEEAECQKKFRANPVPATIFLPLYHDIVQRNEERRRSVRERSKLKLLATQKPFKFIERERQKLEARKMQLKDLSPPENKTKVFRAKPVPKCVYSPDFRDKVKEEELCREIRIRMRAEELLQNSSVPNSRLALKETTKKKKHKSTEPKQMEHKLKIRSVPDFELLHEKFQKRLLQHKKVKPLTVCEPFDLCTSYIPSKKDKILKDMQEDEEKLKETRWPFASPRRKPQMRQSGANPHLPGKVKSKPPKTTESTRRRLQALRNNEKQRRQEYLQELQEMEERVKQMPLLFERVTQKNARIAAEKYYSNRLRALGICPEFVSKKGGAAKSLQFSTAGDFTSIAGRARITKVKVKKRESFEETAGDSPQSEQSWEEEEEEEEKGKGVKTSTPDEQCSDLEDGAEARASPDVLEPESIQHSAEGEEEEEEEAKADLSLGHSQEEEEEEEEAKAGPSLGHSQVDEEEEAKAGPSLDHSQEEEEEEDESRPSSQSDRSHEHEEEAQSEPEAEGAFQYEDEEYESDDSE